MHLSFKNGQGGRFSVQRSWTENRPPCPSKQIDDIINTLSEDDGKEIELDDFEKITLSNISVSYGEKIILHDFSLEIEKNGKYMIVGPSGSGKTTLLELLQKKISPSEGEIMYGNVSYGEIREESLYKKMSYMPQNVIIYDDTIRNNICMYRDVSEEEYQSAVKRAGLSDFIGGLEDRDDYLIKNSGKNISGGEKARIALARTLISNTDIIILDEPFANLDQDNFIKIEETLLNLKDRCVIIVSHITDKNSITRYDKVVKLEDYE